MSVGFEIDTELHVNVIVPLLDVSGHVATGFVTLLFVVSNISKMRFDAVPEYESVDEPSETLDVVPLTVIV